MTRGRFWRFKAVADLNGDGNDDVLVRHTDGRWYYYPMRGRRVIAGRGLADLSRDVDWRFAAAGDFNGDGNADVLLRRPDGRWYYYPMDGRRHLAGQRVASITARLAWRFAGLGDFNADGKDDVLLRRFDGPWHYYPMDGYRHIAAERGAASVQRDLAWSLAERPIVPTNQFVEAAATSGLRRIWGYPPRSGQFSGTFPLEFSGGVAAGDYDGDGDVDLYVVGGSDEPNHLFRNRGDGTFYDIAARVGLDISAPWQRPRVRRHRWRRRPGSLHRRSGERPLLPDGEPRRSIRRRHGRLADRHRRREHGVCDLRRLRSRRRPGLVLTHWGFEEQDDTQTLWRNTGDGIFESVSEESGIAESLIIESLNYQTARSRTSTARTPRT